MIAVIQLRGTIGARQPVKDTLTMLNLGKKHACVLIEENPNNMGMLKRAKDFITWGPASAETEASLRKLMGSGKTAHLHPARGGMRSIKKAYTDKGDLGPRGDAINDLIKRMLP